MLRVGINGFGRIGRAIARINLDHKLFDVVAINDINPDCNNIAYLFKYDSIYGKLEHDISAKKDALFVNDEKIALFSQENIEDVAWDQADVDVIIDATGIKRNLTKSNQLKQKNIKHCILTNSPDQQTDCKWIVVGVNDDAITKSDFFISSSICDANALVPCLNLLNNSFGIDHGFVTTLHPWLGYQNLLDGPALSVSDPGHIHSTYALGRSSINTLIPKTTTCVKATCQVLPEMENKFMSVSYRVPTMIVSSADISIKLKKKVIVEDLISLFTEAQKKQKFEVIYNSYEALTAIDFRKSRYSANIDHRWTMVNSESYCKLILWYDNEWGYSCRVNDLVTCIGNLYE
jgi:glyceraldehyde 3-phosphate dehydrogenase